MTDSEIFEMLAEIESELFHRWTDMNKSDPGYEEAKSTHKAAREAFEAFAKLMGYAE